MFVNFWNTFTKITAYPLQKLLFRTKIYYEAPDLQKRRIKGPAIIICNHTSVYDYAVLLFVFFARTARFQMAEVLFKKPVLGTFLKMLGGIYVDRNAKNFGFVAESLDILERGGVVGIFPEGRIPLEGESRPLPFKASAAYIALASGIPIIPVYTNGSYFSRKRAAVIVGAPLTAEALASDGATDKERIANAAEIMRTKITELGALLDEKQNAHKG